MKKIIVGFLFLLVSNLFATTFTVNSTTFSNTGAGTSGDLLYCINQAGGSAGAPHTIVFSIAAGSTITLLTDISITSNPNHVGLTINGFIDAVDGPDVIIRGDLTLNRQMQITVSGVKIYGLVFQNMNYGININGTTGCQVKGCYFGSNLAGSAVQNGIARSGVFINGGGTNTGHIVGGTATTLANGANTSSNNSERCLFVGNCYVNDNLRYGAVYLDNAGNVQIINNYFGTDITGVSNLGVGATVTKEPNNHACIYLKNNNTINNLINRNVISGSTGCGIYAEINANNNTVTGNKIGTNAAGTAPIPNEACGIFMKGLSGNAIGGTAAGAGNLISGNGGAKHNNYDPNCHYGWNDFNQYGVYCENILNCTFKGNYVGTDVNGINNGVGNNLGNRAGGIKIVSQETGGASTGNMIGGFTAADRNIISGNGFLWSPNSNSGGCGAANSSNMTGGPGITLQYGTCTNNTIAGNYIGLAFNGIAPLGNGQDGINILGAKNNTIQGNVIANNLWGIIFQIDFGYFGGVPTNVRTATGNIVISNVIGLNINSDIMGNGTRAGDTEGGGICLQIGSSGNFIGRANANEGNIISGNRNGIVFRNSDNGTYAKNQPTANTVYNNIIGLDILGNAKLNVGPGANNGHGIVMTNGTSGNSTMPSGNTIGGTLALQANVISGNEKNGIHIYNAQAGTLNCTNTISGNYIGIYSDGNTAKPNGLNGIYATAVSSVTIGGVNIISGNTLHGIQITNGTGHSVYSNIIGLNSAGTAKVPNLNGVYLGDDLVATGPSNCLIGGLASTARNFISGNTQTGVKLKGATGNTIRFNYIGTDLAGNADLGNGFHGMDIFSASNTNTIRDNVISGNGDAGQANLGNGISVFQSNTITVQGNKIGTNAAGTAVIANQDAGFSSTESNNNVIGGTSAALSNVISGNGTMGIYMSDCDNALIQGNNIGVGTNGTTPMGNTSSGIYLAGGGVGNIIGGVSAGESNLIGHNGANGVVVDGATTINNSIHKNSIFCNALRGIVLSNGGNNNYAKPTMVIQGNGDIQVNGPAGSFIEVFQLDGCNDCGSNPTNDKLQGKTFLTTFATGGTFTPVVGTFYTATASAGNTTAAHNTSEFSICYTTCIAPTAPTLITINIVANHNICENYASQITLTATGGTNLEWYEGSCPLAGTTAIASGSTYTLPSTPTSTTHYFVRSKDMGCGASACKEDSIVIHKVPVIPTDITPVGPYCAGTSGNFNLVANGGTANGATLNWYAVSCGGTFVGTGNNVSQAIPAATTDYFVRYESQYCGNTNCVSTTLTINPQPTALTSFTFSTGSDICANFSGDVTLTAATLASGDQIEWFVDACGTGTNIGTANPATLNSSQFTNDTMIVFVRSKNTCATTACVKDTLFIHSMPQTPSNVASSMPSVCSGTTGSMNLSATNNGGEKLVWTSISCNGTVLGQGTPLSVSVPSTNTTYFVHAESAFCPNSACAQATVTVNNAPTPSITGPSAICAGGDSTYSTTATGNNFVWSYSPSGATIQNGTTNSILLQIIASGTLSVMETDPATSCSTSVSKAITLNSATGPLALAGNNSNLCASSLTLNANNVSGTWMVVGVPTAVFTPDANTYNASVSGLNTGANQLIWTTTGSCGYMDDDTIVVTVGVSTLDADIDAPSDTQCVGAERNVQVTITSAGSGDYTYVWTSSDNSINKTTQNPNVSFTPGSGNVVIYLTVVDNQNTGCDVSVKDSIFTVGDQELVIPNLITPNGDGKNDYFELKDLTDMSILPGSYLEVTNRWGQYVYKDQSYVNTWKGDDANDGVYYYYLKTGCGDRAYKGWVQIIR